MESHSGKARTMRTAIRYYPPQNFGMVEEDLYRSSAPTSVNFPFLDTLKLKTIIYLSPDDPSDKLYQFCEEQSIAVIRPAEDVTTQSKLMTLPEEAVIQSLDTLLDRRHYPVLVSCQLGRHKTGMVIGCLRKLQGWSLSSIFAEYQRYAGKTRVQNEQFIELFDRDLVLIPRESPAVWFTRLREVQHRIVESKQSTKQEQEQQREEEGVEKGGGAGQKQHKQRSQGKREEVGEKEVPVPEGGGKGEIAELVEKKKAINVMEEEAGEESKWSLHPHRPLSTTTSNALHPTDADCNSDVKR